jgi:hypothetical protein
VLITSFFVTDSLPAGRIVKLFRGRVSIFTRYLLFLVNNITVNGALRMTGNNKAGGKLKWYLLAVIASLVIIFVLTLRATGPAFAYEGPSLENQQKIIKTESSGSSASARNYSTGIPVRCNVVIEK